MSDAFVIEHHDLTAGIAVRERGGFRFYSSDALFRKIDARRFRRLREIRLAVKRLTDAARAATADPAASSFPRDGKPCNRSLTETA